MEAFDPDISLKQTEYVLYALLHVMTIVVVVEW